MTQLEELFETWNNTINDTPEIILAWKKVEIELKKTSADNLTDLIFDYTTAAQKEAFSAGFKKGMLLILEVIGDAKN